MKITVVAATMQLYLAAVDFTADLVSGIQIGSESEHLKTEVLVYELPDDAAAERIPLGSVLDAHHIGNSGSGLLLLARDGKAFGLLDKSFLGTGDSNSRPHQFSHRRMQMMRRVEYRAR